MTTANSEAAWGGNTNLSPLSIAADHQRNCNVKENGVAKGMEYTYEGKSLWYVMLS